MRQILPRAKHARAWLAVFAVGFLVYAAVHAQPSRHIRIAVGAVGAGFYETALRYKALLEPKGYRVDIVSFPNTNEIAARVADDHADLDLGFVAAREDMPENAKLMPLGEVQLQPIFIFENRGAALTHPVRTFSDLRGLSLVLPPSDSLTSDTMRRVFALAGIDATNTRIAYLPFQDGVRRLKQGQFDAGLFILAADSDLAKALAKDDRLTMVEIAQQRAIAAKLPYLREVTLPAGIYDVARRFKKIGEHSTYGMGPHEIMLLADGKTIVAGNGGQPAGRDRASICRHGVGDAQISTHRAAGHAGDDAGFK